MNTDSEKKKEEQHRKELARIALTYGSLLEAITSLEMTLLKENADNNYIRQLCWNTFVIAYSRPFTSNNKLGMESPKIVLAEFKDLHEKVITRYRNQAVAHHDPSVEDLNELIFTMKGGAIRFDPLKYHPKIEELSECHRMVESVCNESSERFLKCLSRYPEVAHFPDGYFRFRLDAEVGNEWEEYLQEVQK